MGLVSNLFDLNLLVEMVELQMVTIKPHPKDDLWILNYTATAQYTSTWNEVTRNCRGLITHKHPLTDEDSSVVARPFEKFFNMAEHGPDMRLDALPLDRYFDVFGKMDGSLGILYESSDGPAVATRGSFSSDQAIWATRFLKDHLNDRTVPDGTTLLFEIIYPTNRIVVDYGDHEGLTYLGAIDIDTGADATCPDEWADWLPRVQQYNGMNDLDTIKALIEATPQDWLNHEGFVLRFAPAAPNTPSMRVKAKFSDYVRLHRIVTGVSAKTIWEFLSTGNDMSELLDHVPDEFYDWVTRTATSLQDQFNAIEAQCRQTMTDERVRPEDRRSTAEFFQGQPHRTVLFKMLDGRDYKPLIWRSIKPAAEKPFKTDTDS